jgi:hypothetical protein
MVLQSPGRGTTCRAAYRRGTRPSSLGEWGAVSAELGVSPGHSPTRRDESLPVLRRSRTTITPIGSGDLERVPKGDNAAKVRPVVDDGQRNKRALPRIPAQHLQEDDYIRQGHPEPFRSVKDIRSRADGVTQIVYDDGSKSTVGAEDLFEVVRSEPPGSTTHLRDLIKSLSTDLDEDEVRRQVSAKARELGMKWPDSRGEMAVEERRQRTLSGRLHKAWWQVTMPIKMYRFWRDRSE